MLLSDVLEEYLYHTEVEKYSHRTTKGYKNNNSAFFRFVEADFKVMELEKVRPIHN